MRARQRQQGAGRRGRGQGGCFPDPRGPAEPAGLLDGAARSAGSCQGGGADRGRDRARIPARFARPRRGGDRVRSGGLSEASRAGRLAVQAGKAARGANSRPMSAGGCDAFFTPGAAMRRPRRGLRTSGPETQSCCASPIRIPSRPGSPMPTSTTMSASSSGPGLGDRSTAIAITIGTSASYRHSKDGASNSRRCTSAVTAIGSSSCSATSCPRCGRHCRTCGASICFQAAATGPSRSGRSRSTITC